MAPRLSQWPRGLKCGSAAARVLTLWMSVVSIVCCQVLYPWELETGSCVDRAVVLLMDPLGHLRITSRPLVEVLNDVL